MAEFNKETALDELLKFFTPDAPLSQMMREMQKAQNYLEAIHLNAFEKGLEMGIKKIELDNEKQQ